MDIVLGLIISVLQDGFIYGIMAIGVYVTYQVLNFPDLSVDGTFPLGACVTAALISRGVNPFIACIAAILCGAAAGGITGILHVKLHITDLLSGILVMTGLWSINLVIVGGSSILAYYNQPTVFTSGPAALISKSMFQWRNLIVVFVFCMVIKFVTDIYLKTKSGLLLRASGDNQQYVVSLGKDPGNMKILGLMIGNGFTALAGCILSQQSESADVTSGTGMVVMALASVIIGINIFSRFKIIKPTMAVVLGAIVYKACLMIALQLGLPANYMKLLMAVLFTVALLTNRIASFAGGRKERNAAETRT